MTFLISELIISKRSIDHTKIPILFHTYKFWSADETDFK